MFNSDKPLFSRPVLAAIMLLCTLSIWLLNLIATNNTLPTPTIERWTTTSGIPVIWLKQEEWENTDKVELRFSFHSATTNTALIQTTLAMLMSDSLPLSTASINQRLAPLAASANSYYDHESQTIGLTLSNETRYLLPTLSLVTNWLSNPDFKRRTFDNWQSQRTQNPPIQHELENALFFDKNNKQISSNSVPVSLEQVIDYYQRLKSSATAIYIIGELPTEAKNTLQAALNKISQEYQIATSPNESIYSEPLSTIIKQNEGTLWQTRSAIALMPVTDIKEWISLQIWGADLVATLNKQTHIDFVQLALTLSPQHPWAWWSIQYGNSVASPDATTNRPADQMIYPKSLAFSEQVPSANNKKMFQTLLDSFKSQLEQQTLSPTWWSQIATQVTHENGALNLEKFANGYQEAVDSFTVEEYQAALTRLLRPSSYQEIQVYQ